MRWKQSMVPLKKVRKDTRSPSESTLRTLALTSIPGSSDPIVNPSHSCTCHAPLLNSIPMARQASRDLSESMLCTLAFTSISSNSVLLLAPAIPAYHTSLKHNSVSRFSWPIHAVCSLSTVYQQTQQHCLSS